MAAPPSQLYYNSIEYIFLNKRSVVVLNFLNGLLLKPICPEAVNPWNLFWPSLY